MLKTDDSLERLFPYLKGHSRIRSFVAERSPYIIHEQDLSKMNEKELFKVLRQIDRKLSKIDGCLAIHAKDIIGKRNLSHMTYHIASFLVESEMKRHILIYRAKVKKRLRFQKRLTRFLKD